MRKILNVAAVDVEDMAYYLVSNAPGWGWAEAA